MLDLESEQRSIRVFISSTFRDLQRERDHLTKFVFPKLRKLCQSRGVDFTDIDLRWGVTEEQLERGDVIEICLREIDRCRPYFIGILGDRYGWIPGPEEYKKQNKIMEDFSWVKKDIEEGLSITEIEIQYGVLRNPVMESRAFFYFRDSSKTPEEYNEQRNSETTIKLEKLKSLIKGKKIFPCRYTQHKSTKGY